MAKNLSFERSLTPDNPITVEELRSGGCILAHLIAAAYAADHPESCGNEREGNLEEGARSRSLQALVDNTTPQAYSSGKSGPRAAETASGP